jgi:hypothetical protein
VVNAPAENNIPDVPPLIWDVLRKQPCKVKAELIVNSTELEDFDPEAADNHETSGLVLEV